MVDQWEAIWVFQGEDLDVRSKYGCQDSNVFGCVRLQGDGEVTEVGKDGPIETAETESLEKRISSPEIDFETLYKRAVEVEAIKVQEVGDWILRGRRSAPISE